MLEQDFPEITQKQIHAWWTVFIQNEFVRDINQVNSAKIFLDERKYRVIMFNNYDGIKLLGFITSFFDKFKGNKEIFVDATYKTNALGYELYSVISQYDGSGFALAYLFVEECKQDGARTEIIAEFFKILLDLGMNKLVYLYTDKDFAQISAAKQMWSNIKIQLCYWHFKRALKKRLADNSQPKKITYSSHDANNSFDFIDINFYSVELQKSNFCFCPKNLWPQVISLMEYHMHLHPLIPNLEGIFSTKDEIWKQCTKEMYDFCVTNDLRYLWSYLWINWYRNKLWQL